MKYIIKEVINDKKINSIINKYKELATKNNNRTEKILVLVPNSKIRLNYDRKIDTQLNLHACRHFLKNEKPNSIEKYAEQALSEQETIKIKSKEYEWSDTEEYEINF